MCNKGDWVREIRAGNTVQGFFRMERGRKDRSLRLTDVSGSIPILSNKVTSVSNLAGKVVWASGFAERCGFALTLQLIAAVPAICWTGNPFALTQHGLSEMEDIVALAEHVRRIEDKELKQLIDDIFSDAALLHAFLNAPASIKHHHAWPGGLVKHTREVMDMAVHISACLIQSERDLVMTACLLHDAGKAFEYQQGGRWLSPRGRLLGHEITLLELFSPVADCIWSHGNPKRMMLLHLLTAKPAPQWTGIRHPRTRLVSIVRFADRWSIDEDVQGHRSESQNSY